MSEKEKPRRPPKSRTIVCDLYTDNEKHMSTIAKMKNQEDIEFWCILHNEDVYTSMDYGQYIVDHKGKMPEWNIGDHKKDHYHCVFYCHNPRYAEGLAYEIGLHEEDAHLFQVCHDPIKYTHYLWHNPEIWSEKHQYDPETIEGNVTGLLRCKAYLKKRIDYEDDKQYQRILDYIDTVDVLTISTFTKWCIKNGLITFYEVHNRVIKPYLDNEIKNRNLYVEKDEVSIMALDTLKEEFGKA